MANEQIHVPQNPQARAVETAQAGLQRASDPSTATLRRGSQATA